MTSRRLDDCTMVVLAPNPSAMTLEGTNTYLVSAPGSGEAIVVDPGPDSPDHRRAVEAAVAAMDAEIAAVVLTHHHRDHAEAAGWAAVWNTPLYAFAPGMIAAAATGLRDGALLAAGGVQLEALHTPGHSSDHLCLRVVQTGAVLTGDHVLGRGTTVVAWPDGEVVAYLRSLRRLAGLGAAALHPGHGPAVADPARVVAAYLAQREAREAQVLAALAAGDRTPAQIVARVYEGVDPALRVMAELSVRAQLRKLVDERRVSCAEGAYDVRA